MIGALPAFDRSRILVIGDAILDEYLIGECSRLSPEAPVPILRVRGTRHGLGGAANTAANVTSLGGRAVLVAIIGHDADGDRLATLAGEAGITFEAVRDRRPTSRKARVVGQNQHLVRLDYEDTTPIEASTEDEALAQFERHVRTCDIVVLPDYAKGFLTRRVCQTVIRLAHEHDKRVVIDPRPEHREFYAGCDYLTPNWNEARELLGHSGVVQTPDRVRDTALTLVRQFGGSALVTLGASGMAFASRDGDEYFEIPTAARDVFDVTGAGDTVVAAFASALAAGADHRTAATLANHAAGIAVGKFGTATVRREELLHEPRAEGRILQRGELADLSATLRAKGKRIVTVNGAFDLLHAGHVHILRTASRQAEVLIVGLNDDASVRRLKGSARPIVPQAERAEMLLALRYVDYVHIFQEDVPMPFLEQVRPDVHVNGAEYGTDCIEAATLRDLGARLHLVERIPRLSTSELLKSVSQAYAR